MKTINATEAKKRLLELIRDTDRSFERYCITRNGEQKAILMSVADYEGWIETLEITHNPRALKEIKQARAELNAGKGIPFAKILESVGDQDI